MLEECWRNNRSQGVLRDPVQVAMAFIVYRLNENIKEGTCGHLHLEEALSNLFFDLLRNKNCLHLHWLHWPLK